MEFKKTNPIFQARRPAAEEKGHSANSSDILVSDLGRLHLSRENEATKEVSLLISAKNAARKERFGIGTYSSLSLALFSAAGVGYSIISMSIAGLLASGTSLVISLSILEYSLSNKA